jgi:hypothetical protein
LKISKEILSKIAESDLDAVAELDANGFLFAPGEKFPDYASRITKMIESFSGFEEKLAKSGDDTMFNFEDICKFRIGDRIPSGIVDEAGKITKSKYGFEIGWTPGFFLAKNIGPLWGGCAILLPESSLAVFLIRSAFSKKKKWFLYRRDELLSHELCHVARMPLHDLRFDEYFAYQLSPSRIRRKFGSSFKRDSDAVLFITPIFLLMLVRIVLFFYPIIPIWPLWILAFLYPAFLFIRNHLDAAIIKKALTILKKNGFKEPDAALFRCSRDEIITLAKFAKSPDDAAAWLDMTREKEIRWKIIFHKFHG